MLARYTDHGLWRGLRSLPAILAPVTSVTNVTNSTPLYVAGKGFPVIQALFQSQSLYSKSRREKGMSQHLRHHLSGD